MPILGLNYLRLRRYDDAIAVLTRATELDPGSSISYNTLGVVYEEMGRYQNAFLATNCFEPRPNRRTASSR